MSTNSIIAIQEKDDSVTGIYCHWDGYPEGVGAMLYYCYQNPDKIRDLVSLGSISSLHEDVFPTEPGHSFDHPQRGVTVAYHRDRGEEFSQIKAENLEEFDCQRWRYIGVTYVYLYAVDEGVWYVNGKPLADYFVGDTETKEICSESDVARAIQEYCASLHSESKKLN